MPEGSSRESEPVVVAEDVGLLYVVDSERIGSFKEHVLERLLRGKTTEELWALRNVSFSLGPGEMLGVFGRNGAGKSTLLRILARSLAPTEGRIRIRGRVAPLLAIGSGFHPDMTAGENVLLNATLLGSTLQEARGLYPDVVAFAELDGRMHLPMRQLSSGMVARLGFAVATAVRPDLLLVDEVLAVGDAGFQQKCLARIDGYRRAGTAIVLVSHQRQAIEWCDRGLVLDAGRVVASGAAGLLGGELQRQLGTTPAPATSEDREVVRGLLARAADERSAGVAVRLFSEVREGARRHGLDLDRVHQLGPGCLPATLACFAASGSEVASSGGTVPQQPLDLEMAENLLDLLKVVGGSGWWRHGVEAHGELPLSAPLAFPAISARELPGRVHLGADPAEIRPDLIFSFGTLAHVADPAGLLAALAGALSPGAGMIHEIDLAHLGFEDRLAPFELSEEEHRLSRRERGEGFRLPEVPLGVAPTDAYCNRWLTSDWLEAHRRAGFEVLGCEPIVQLDEELVRPRRLDSRFRDRPLEDLRTLVVRITSRRRGSSGFP